MIFWMVVIALALMVSGLLILTLMRGQAQTDAAEPAAAYDLQVYRDQLTEVERDLERGLIGKDDAGRVRTEVSRRILAADARVQQAGPEQAQGPSRQSRQSRAVAVVLAALVVGGSVALYSGLGYPGYGDLGLERRIELASQSRENRPSQEQAEAQLPPALPTELDPGYKTLIDQLRAKVASQPDDVQGQVLLAHHEAKSGNFIAAHQAQARVIALMGDTAGAVDHAEYGELLIVAADGYVSPEAEDALRIALELDPRQGPSRYYWGMMLAQTGRPDLAFRIWENTLQLGPPDAPWLVPIRASIEVMAWRAGVEYSLPPSPAAAPPLAGPSSEDIEAAASMSAQDQQQMIRSMVERLSERLGSTGGSPAEWARLISALGVLGDIERAQSIYDEAKTVFASDAATLSDLASVASQAGLTP